MFVAYCKMFLSNKRDPSEQKQKNQLKNQDENPKVQKVEKIQSFTLTVNITTKVTNTKTPKTQTKKTMRKSGKSKTRNAKKINVINVSCATRVSIVDVIADIVSHYFIVPFRSFFAAFFLTLSFQFSCLFSLILHLTCVLFLQLCRP